MVGEGVLAEERPVVAVARLQLLQHGVKLFGEVLDTCAAASEQVEAVGDAHHYGVAREFVEVFKGDGEGFGALTVGEERDALDVLLLAAGCAFWRAAGLWLRLPWRLLPHRGASASCSARRRRARSLRLPSIAC